MYLPGNTINMQLPSPYLVKIANATPAVLHVMTKITFRAEPH